MKALSIGVASAAAVAGLCGGSANAMLVLQGPQNFQGTGLGAVNTVLTIQSPGSSTFEAGAVGRTTGSNTDVISGDALTGASQTQTRSISSLGITSAADIRVVFNALEPGNTAQSISLNNLQLSIYSPTGSLLFNSGAFTPINFPDTFTGAGNSGFVFALDSTQAGQAQASAFVGAGFGSNLIGLTAAASDATGGFETFFVASAGGGGVITPIPEPETYALMLGGLGLLTYVAKRRRKG